MQKTTISYRKTRRAALLTGVAVAPVLAACGTDTGAPPRPQSLAPAKLTLWHHFGGARIPLMDELSRRFGAKYAGLTVEHQVFDIEPRIEKILTAASADGLPDVLMVNRRDLPQYGPLGFLGQLNDLARRDRVTDSLFYEAEIKASYHENKLLALPMVTAGDWQFLYYNRDLFRRAGLDPDKAPPKTWPELRDQAVKLTQRSGDTISQLGYSIHNEFAFQHYASNWLALNGGALLDKTTKKAQLDRPEAVAALEYLVDTTRALGGYAAIAQFQRDYGSPHPLPLGKLAIESRGTPWWFTFKQQQPSLDLGIMLTPPAAGKSIRFGAGDGWAYAVPKAGKFQEQAWKATQFFSLEEEGGGAFVMDQLRPSPVKKLNENPEYKKQHPHWGIVLEMLTKNEAWVWLPVHDAIVREAQPIMNEVRDGKTAPRAASERMQEIAQRKVDEHWKSAK